MVKDVRTEAELGGMSSSEEMRRDLEEARNGVTPGASRNLWYVTLHGKRDIKEAAKITTDLMTGR